MLNQNNTYRSAEKITFGKRWADKQMYIKYLKLIYVHLQEINKEITKDTVIWNLSRMISVTGPLSVTSADVHRLKWDRVTLGLMWSF